MDRSESATAMRRRYGASSPSPIQIGDSEVAYADGAESDILTILKSARDVSSDSVELVGHIVDWPTRYHLDPARANVIRGLDLAGVETALEIGAGCGSITRFLGEQIPFVDALEPMPARALAARERNRDLPGVEVFIGELDAVPDEPAYDLVVVVGVLEYVAGEGRGADAAIDFLAGIRRRLRPGGVLVVAIENKLGVKYLAGAPEDHTGRVFDGLEDYPSGTPARTFSRTALEDLFQDAGFEARKTLGAMPDYKMTRTIMDVEPLVAAASQLAYRIPRFPSDANGSNRVVLADEGRLWRELVNAGVAPDFVNSFVVVAGDPAGLDRMWPADRLANYFSQSRGRGFRAVTEVARGESGVEFRRTFEADPDPIMNIAAAQTTLQAGREFGEVFSQADETRRASLIAAWIDALDEVSDDAGLMIDAIPRNLLVDGDAVRFIDMEFVAPGYDRKFVLGRGVLWLAQEMAATTPPGEWAPAETVRDLAIRFGQLAGLDPNGRWIEPLLDAEAEFLVRVGNSGRGNAVVSRRRKELVELLDASLWTMPLGRRAHEEIAPLVAEINELTRKLNDPSSAWAELDAYKTSRAHRLTERTLRLLGRRPTRS